MRESAVWLLACCSFVVFADTTVRTRTTDSVDGQKGALRRATYYRHDFMRRKDTFLGRDSTPLTIEIVNCNTSAGLLIDPSAREYRPYKAPIFVSGAEKRENLKSHPELAVPIQAHTSDTGERNSLLGLPAVHLVTEFQRASNGEREAVDGWYVDLPHFGIGCVPDDANKDPWYALATTLGGDRIPDIYHTGPLPTGVAVKLTITDHFHRPNASDSSTEHTVIVQQTIEEYSDASLDGSLFVLPVGLHENPKLIPGESRSDR